MAGCDDCCDCRLLLLLLLVVAVVAVVVAAAVAVTVAECSSSGSVGNGAKRKRRVVVAVAEGYGACCDDGHDRGESATVESESPADSKPTSEDILVSRKNKLKKWLVHWFFVHSTTTSNMLNLRCV
jgi:hypothetical protein